jgi:hypothetical protein
MTSDLERKTIPNQGIWKSAVNALIAGLGTGLISEMIFKLTNELFTGLGFGLGSGVGIGLGRGIWVGIGVGMGRGGIACIQHFTLRLVLYHNGYIPWNYARFLDYATERLYLQRVGGRYRFIHKLLQEHFAQMDFSKSIRG